MGLDPRADRLAPAGPTSTTRRNVVARSADDSDRATAPFTPSSMSSTTAFVVAGLDDARSAVRSVVGKPQYIRGNNEQAERHARSDPSQTFLNSPTKGSARRY